jgi:hypothetical protein
VMTLDLLVNGRGESACGTRINEPAGESLVVVQVIVDKGRNYMEFISATKSAARAVDGTGVINPERSRPSLQTGEVSVDGRRRTVIHTVGSLFKAVRIVGLDSRGRFYRFTSMLSICSPGKYQWSPGRLTGTLDVVNLP